MHGKAASANLSDIDADSAPAARAQRAEAQALVAIAADWLDESERTIVKDETEASPQNGSAEPDPEFDSAATTFYAREQRQERAPVVSITTAKGPSRDLFDDLEHTPDRPNKRIARVDREFAITAASTPNARKSDEPEDAEPRSSRAAPHKPSTRRRRAGGSTIPGRARHASMLQTDSHAPIPSPFQRTPSARAVAGASDARPAARATGSSPRATPASPVPYATRTNANASRPDAWSTGHASDSPQPRFSSSMVYTPPVAHVPRTPRVLDRPPTIRPPTILPPRPDESALEIVELEPASASISGSRPRVTTAHLEAYVARDQKTQLTSWSRLHGLETSAARVFGRAATHFPRLLWLVVPTAAALLASSVVWALRDEAEDTLPVRAAAAAHAGSTEASLTFTSSPSGAQILLDGQPLGIVTPARLSRVAVGLHAVEFRLPGYMNSTTAAVSVAGESVAVPRVVMHPAARLLASGTARPAEPNAASPLKDVAATAVQPTASQATAQPRAASTADTARRPRTRPAARGRSATSGSSRRARVQRPMLTPAPGLERNDTASAPDSDANGTLRVNSRPWARVSIDGRFVGHTPQRSIALPAGRHLVQLVNEPLHMSKTFEVTIADGQTVTRVELLDED